MKPLSSNKLLDILSFRRLVQYLDQPTSIAPLITFRVLFGAMMVFSTIRFWALGWIEDHFINTTLTFKYFGFEWVTLLPAWAMYGLHLAMLLGAIGITLGFLYRFSALLFFMCFTYVELVDLTYYLNHYYFVSISSLLLALVPADRRFALDAYLHPTRAAATTPRWTILIFQWQIAIVYIYAGLAKLNYDWLILALPLKIWLPAKDSLPLIGPIFKWEITPYLFSWFGMLYDTCIVFFLSWRKTRVLAYLSVIVFHTLTGLLFQIGIFPLVMIGATWIFFSPAFHERLLRHLEKPLPALSLARPLHFKSRPLLLALMGLYFSFQLLFPWRYTLYPGNLFWNEEGYRFSWRVMLMEKAGTATFYVKDAVTGREGVVDNREFLRPHQEKQMSFQPDLILQYAHFLEQYYQDRGVNDPSVRAEVYVTLNARPSRLLIDPTVDLTEIKDGWTHKEWILPWEDAQQITSKYKD